MTTTLEERSTEDSLARVVERLRAENQRLQEQVETNEKVNDVQISVYERQLNQFANQLAVAKVSVGELSKQTVSLETKYQTGTRVARELVQKLLDDRSKCDWCRDQHEHEELLEEARAFWMTP